MNVTLVEKVVASVPAKWQTLILTPVLLVALGAMGREVWAARQDSASKVRVEVENVQREVRVLRTEQIVAAAKSDEASKRFEDLVRRFDSLESANLEVLRELRRRDKRDNGAGGTR